MVCNLKSLCRVLTFILLYFYTFILLYFYTLFFYLSRKKSMKYSLLFMCLFSTFNLSANESEIQEKRVAVYCPESCDIDKSIDNFIKDVGGLSGEVMIDVLSNNQVVYTTTVASHQGLIKNPLSEPISVLDASLKCEWDRDFSCNDWESDELWGNYAMGVRGELKNIVLEFPVSQSYAATLNRVNNWIFNAMTFSPTGAVAAYIAKFGTTALWRVIIASSVGATMIDQLNQLNRERFNKGDVILVTDGDFTHVSASDIANDIVPIPSLNKGEFICYNLYVDIGAGPTSAGKICYSRSAQ